MDEKVDKLIGNVGFGNLSTCFFHSTGDEGANRQIN